MTRLYKTLIKNVLFIALFTSPLSLTAGEAERQAVNELLDVTRFEKMMDDSINASIQMVNQMSPEMANHEAILRKFYKKYMSAESLRQDLVEMYSEIFSVSELKDITAFYKSKTGQKAMEKLPEIMQRSMQIAQKRVMENMGELQEMLAQEHTAE